MVTTQQHIKKINPLVPLAACSNISRNFGTISKIPIVDIVRYFTDPIIGTLLTDLILKRK